MDDPKCVSADTAKHIVPWEIRRCEPWTRACLGGASLALRSSLEIQNRRYERGFFGRGGMSTYVLVHGAWHGAWCWYRVASQLRRAGHTVIVPDLAGLGKDKTPIAEVSLARWTEDICEIVDAAPEPVILVGHSRGGIVISEVAERRPDTLAVLVYLAAFLLRDGETLLQVAQTDGTSLALPNLVVGSDGTYCTVREDALKEVFYGECPDEDLTLAKLLLAPEPMAPSITPVHVSHVNFGSVPRIYIECHRDNAIPLALQRAMQANVPCQKVLSMDTDHSPFFSAPEALVADLTALSDAGAA
jgi:pimeloyl-ACP methyl ester carboxylesterase